MLTVGSLFSGIGGLDLGLERAGMRVLWQCESDPYCRAVLRKHWPDVPCFEDVKAILADSARIPKRGAEAQSRANGQRVGASGYACDVLVGGFPCQPVSLAGRRRGAADERWLWPEFARLIRLLRPRYALMENVPGLLVGGGMAEVLGDLAALGYDAEWDCVAAAHVGAPHLRFRVFVVAYPHRDSQPSQSIDAGSGQGILVQGLADATLNGWQPRRSSDAAQEPGGRESDQGGGSLAMADADTEPTIWTSIPRPERHPWLTEPDVGRVAHGVPSRVDRLRALGNAVVPQVAEIIGRFIVQHAEVSA